MAEGLDFMLNNYISRESGGDIEHKRQERRLL